MMEKKNYYSELVVSGNPIWKDGLLWLISAKYDVLLKCDWNNKLILEHYTINVDRTWYGHYKCVLNNDGSLFVFPLLGKGVYSFDIENERFNRISYVEVNESFYIAEAIDDRVIAVEHNSGRIIEINKNHKVSYVDGFIRELLVKSNVDEDKILFSSEYCRIGNSLILLIRDSNAFVIFDMTKFEAKFYRLMDDEHVYSVFSDGDSIIFTTNNNSIITWKAGRVVNHIGNEDDKKCLYLKPVVLNGKCYVFPWKKREFYKLEKDKLYRIPLDYMVRSDLYPTDTYDQFQWASIYDEKIYLQSRYNGDLFVIDGVSNGVDVLRLKDENEVIVRLMNDLKANNNYNYLEDDLISLENFLKVI